jgi:uncharacterized protein
MKQVLDLNDAEVSELDDLLAMVPEPFEALDVVALDGYLCGVLAQPTPVSEAQWLPGLFDWNWGETGVAALDEHTPGWHSAKQERALNLIRRRHAALNRAIFEDQWFDPLVMVPEDENGKPLQGKAAIEASLGLWSMGFEHAQNLFVQLADLPNQAVQDLLTCIWRHLPAQSDEEVSYAKALDLEHPLTSLDMAIEDLVGNVVELIELGRRELVAVAPIRREGQKVGRNDPCPCGSGRKFKACHGREPSGS